MNRSPAALVGTLDDELSRDVPGPVRALADALVAKAGPGVVTVLFYGSSLRDATLTGVLDFYLLTDATVAWPGRSRLARWAGRVLPPNVGYLETVIDGKTLRAKVAAMPLARFAAAMSTRRIDTTLWARFSQPFRCVHARDAAGRAAVVAAAADAVCTAARWAALLGPVRGEALDFWRTLYARTYAAELRVEGSGRAIDLVGSDAGRFEALLIDAWHASKTPFLADGKMMSPQLSTRERNRAMRAWRLRRRLGRPLNALRLLKAATTFDNAIDYVAWKIERHSGFRIEPTAFQRRHPLLAAPLLYWRLRSRGVLR